MCNAEQLFTVYSSSSLKLLFNHDSLTIVFHKSGPPPLPLVKFLGMWELWHVGDWVKVEVPLCQKQGNSEFES